MRIISLISSATEIICNLGCSDFLVGISHECDYPETIIDLPVCSEPRFNVDGSSIEVDNQVKSLLQEALSIYRIREDKISELNPDIIITQSQCNVCAVSIDDVQNALKKNLKINPQVISLEPNTLNDVWMDIKKLGIKINENLAADKIISTINNEIMYLKKHNQNKSNIDVACIEWIEPLMFAGNWVPEIVDIAGGNDSFGQVGKHSSWSNYSELYKKNPDKIIFMPCGYSIDKTKIEIEILYKTREWMELKAVKSGNIYIADGSQYFNRPGPRLFDSIKIMNDIIFDRDRYGFLGKGWEKIDKSFVA
tara:strand:- start:869 stop:1792 length:924 start_codon:yes stop_codon:yes gene_type:complete